MKTKSLTFAAYLVSILGIMLHVYLTFFHSMKDSIYYLIVPALNVVPYLACMVVIRYSTSSIIPLCSGLLLLFTDFYQFHDYFFSTRTYRFLMVESFLIILKSAVVLPIGCLAGYLTDKLIKRYATDRCE